MIIKKICLSGFIIVMALALALLVLYIATKPTKNGNTNGQVTSVTIGDQTALDECGGFRFTPYKCAIKPQASLFSQKYYLYLTFDVTNKYHNKQNTIYAEKFSIKIYDGTSYLYELSCKQFVDELKSVDFNERETKFITYTTDKFSSSDFNKIKDKDFRVYYENYPISKFKFSN